MIKERKDIVCIGTSNCVIGRHGFIKSLSKKHNVTNLSIGRSPFYMHITTILRNKTLIEKNDLLIIDHLSNPNFMNSFKYNDYLVKFYDLLASLNVNIIIISFPHLMKKSFFIEHRLKAQKLADDRNLTFIDFKAEYVRREFFSDAQHIHIFSSYIFGEWLSEVVDSLNSLSKPTNGSFSGFEIITPKNYSNKFKTSIIDVEYYNLKNKEIQFKVNGYLLSIEYISNGINKFTLNDKCYHVDSFEKGLYQDSFNEKLYFDGILILKDSISQNTQPVIDRNGISRKEVNNSLSLVSLLFEKEFKNTPSTGRSLIRFNIDALKEKLDDYESIILKNKTLKDEEITSLAISAMNVEKFNIKLLKS